MNESSITSLLTQVSLIRKKYWEIAELTGENFNIFRILKMETREVRTHSAFLAELLNPEGSHGQGDVFLKLFIEEVREGETVERRQGPEYDPKFRLADFSTAGSMVRVEYRIGPKTENDGGQIDILVLSGNNKLIIENKINAADQENQLVRYNNFDPNAPLYYLTLREDQKPGDHSKGELQEGNNYKRISYENEILNWLEKCREKAVNHALLRETLTQYIFLIKHLTHQSINKKMEEEVIGLVLKNKESFEAYETLQSTNVRNKDLVNKQVEPQLMSLSKSRGFSCRKHYPDDYGGYSYYLKIGVANGVGIDVGFAFNDTFYSYGFVQAGDEKSVDIKLAASLKDKMARLFENEKTMGGSGIWLAWQNQEYDFEMLSAIWEGKLVEHLGNKLDKLVKIARAFPMIA